MIRRDNKNTNRSERQKPEQHAKSHRGYRKKQEGSERPGPKVAGIKSNHRIKDDEEKLLSRRPRLRSFEENREKEKEAGRKKYHEDRPYTRKPGFRSPDGTRDSEKRSGPRAYGEEKHAGRRSGFRRSDNENESERRPERKSYNEEKYAKSPRFKATEGNRDSGNRGRRKTYGEGNDDSHRGFQRKSKPQGSKADNSYGKKLIDESDGIRLNRYIANAGVCSRREADRYIETGLVTINDKIVTELGTKVNQGDVVKFDGRKLIPEKKVYLLLNKPKNVVTTTDDPNDEKTVMDLIKNACNERVYPVGRLDKNTTGLLLFTNDGDMSKRLTHPSFNNKKIYQVSLDKPVTKMDLQKIADGIELEDGLIAADNISYIDQENKNEIGIEIHSGKNRVVRRIFEHLGYNVRKLDRVYYAGLTKKNLPRGQWRFLMPKEISFLKMK